MNTQGDRSAPMPASSARTSLNAEAVLVTGVYGSGKSTVIADIGKLLQDRGEPYGLLDVDWLGWFNVGEDRATHRKIVLSNIASLCGTYLGLGVRRFALAWSIRDVEQLDGVRAAVPARLTLVRLAVDEALVRQRLSADPTEERQGDDLSVALEWLSSGRGVGLEDLLLPGDQPVRKTSETICTCLGWI